MEHTQSKVGIGEARRNFDFEFCSDLFGLLFSKAKHSVLHQTGDIHRSLCRKSELGKKTKAPKVLERRETRMNNFVRLCTLEHQSR